MTTRIRPRAKRRRKPETAEEVVARVFADPGIAKRPLAGHVLIAELRFAGVISLDEAMRGPAFDGQEYIRMRARGGAILRRLVSDGVLFVVRPRRRNSRRAWQQMTIYQHRDNRPPRSP